MPPVVGPGYAQAFARKSARSVTVRVGLSGSVTMIGKSKALELPIWTGARLGSSSTVQLPLATTMANSAPASVTDAGSSLNPDGKPAGVLSGTERVDQVVFRPDGLMLAALSLGRQVTVWDVRAKAPAFRGGACTAGGF